MSPHCVKASSFEFQSEFNQCQDIVIQSLLKWRLPWSCMEWATCSKKLFCDEEHPEIFFLHRSFLTWSIGPFKTCSEARYIIYYSVQTWRHALGENTWRFLSDVSSSCWSSLRPYDWCIHYLALHGEFPHQSCNCRLIRPNCENVTSALL